MKKLGNNRYVVAMLTATISVFFIFILRHFDLFHSLELKTIDLRYQLRGPYTGLLGTSNFSSENLDVVLVDLDDESWRLIPEQWPYPRDVWARVTDNLVRAGAKVIVFDIMFDSPGAGYAKGDSIFAASIHQAERKGTSVILAAKKATEQTRVPPTYIQNPLDIFIDAGASVGLINEVKDADGFTRNYLMYDRLQQGSAYYPSLALETFHHFITLEQDYAHPILQQTLDGHVALDFNSIPQIERINFYGPPSYGGPEPPVGPWKTFHRYPLSGILDDASYDLKVQQEDTNWMELFYSDGLLGEFGMSEESPFQDKIVMIGVSLAEFHDLKETPYYNFRGYQDLMPGFEIHANALQMLLDKLQITDISNTTLFFLILASALILSVTIVTVHPVAGAVSFIFISWLYVEISFGFFFREFFWSIPLLFNAVFSPETATPFVGAPSFGSSVYVPVMFPLVAFAGTYAGNVLFQFISTRKEKKWIKDAFGHFLHPEIVQEITDNPERLKLGGVRRNLTVFFSDIENFTTIAEQMSAGRLVSFLNHYLTELTDIILKHNGIIDKYEGDAIMAEFGAPIENPEHAKLACKTAIKIQRRLNELRDEWSDEGIQQIYTRIGINTGEVALGNFGSRDVFDYTAMGDTVNLGARLESANKNYGTYIMISQYTESELDESFIRRPLDKVIVKGKTEPVIIYELLDDSSDHLLVSDNELLSKYTEGFEQYLQRNWEAAESNFNCILEHDPNDRPTTILRDRCRKYQESEPGMEWDGAFSLTEK
ncbi:MAG: CHASE2 domain-containing protein [Candidatus Marinimicrobia bacterium]|nr:CHASE2 domain-containing protein [Candidatus Neomarinimicrobiota bacterium]